MGILYYLYLKTKNNRKDASDQCNQKKSPNVYKSCPKMISLEKWKKLLQQTLKSCPKCNKLPNLVTLRQRLTIPIKIFQYFFQYKELKSLIRWTLITNSVKAAYLINAETHILIQFCCLFFFLNGPTRPLFRIIFGLFKQTSIHFLQKNQCENFLIPSSIWRRDSNPQPLNHESSPITTRPGLPPLK